MIYKAMVNVKVKETFGVGYNFLKVRPPSFSWLCAEPPTLYLSTPTIAPPTTPETASSNLLMILLWWGSSLGGMSLHIGTRWSSCQCGAQKTAWHTTKTTGEIKQTLRPCSSAGTVWRGSQTSGFWAFI